MFTEILVASIVSVAIPLAGAAYWRKQDTPPTNRQKRIVLYLFSVAFFVSASVVRDAWDLIDQSYAAFQPLASGATIGLSALLIYCVYAYGWIDSDDAIARNGQPGGE